MQDTLGVDLGGVIAKGNDEEVPGAFDALHRLNVGRFRDRVYIVSRVSGADEERSRSWWLLQHSFSDRTGIKSEHLYFCRERREKAPICQSLGVTHFIDDRTEVLSHMIGIVPNLYLFNPKFREMTEFHQYLSRVQIVFNWHTVEGLLEGR